MIKRLAFISIVVLAAGLAERVNGQPDVHSFELKGQVRDVETDEPLPGVNIFLDQTQKGASSDENGNFTIKNIDPGSYSLVASMIGFELMATKISVPEMTSKRFLIGLTPSVTELSGITVKAERTDKWRRNLERFKEAVLGSTQNAMRTEIENPEILEFRTEGDKLIAVTRHNPLIITNHTLGYSIKFYLQRIELDDEYLNTAGFAQYGELTPTGEKAHERWQERRKQAYTGSFRHFIHALVIDSLEAEGFHAFFTDKPGDLNNRRYIRQLVNNNGVEGRVYSPEALIAPAPKPGQIYLTNPDSKYIGVAFSKEEADRKIARQMKTNLRQQVSLIELPGDTAWLDIKTANYKQAYRPVLHGYWSRTSRIPDLLPDDFDKDILNADLYPDSPLPIFERIADSMWERGNRFIENENYEAALQLWEGALAGRRKVSLDPRIGFRYIELVTEQELRNKYKTAFRMYYAALSGASDPKFKDELTLEVERLEPIAERELYRKWEQLLRDDRLEELAGSIKGFWRMKDPTLSTPFNERLLEHWERLAYVRTRYRRTDDRTKIYVAYGAPDNQIREQSSSLKEITRGQSLKSNPGYAPIKLRNSQSTASEESSGDGLKPGQQAREIGEVLVFSNQVWVYSNMSPGSGDDDVVFLFGNDSAGQFRLLNSVSEMIPSKYFRYDMNPLPILKSLYYNLGLEHPFFYGFYDDLEMQETLSDTPPHALGKMIGSQNRARLSQNRAKAPVEYSEYEAALTDIPLDVYQYRLLDDRNEPVLATYVESRPLRGVFIDQIKEDAFDLSTYRLSHSTIVVKNSQTTFFRNSTPARIQKDYGRVRQMQPALSYVEIPHSSTRSEQIFTAELYNRLRSTNKLSENLFPESLRGLGKQQVMQPVPLSSDSTVLEMSDLMIGYETDENEPFGLRVATGREIPRGEELIVYFEIYHLETTPEQPSAFTIDYRLEPKRNVLETVFGKREQVRLTLNYEARQASHRDNLKIDTTALEPGEYTLTLRATEPATGREKNRSVTFTISGI